MWRSTLLSICLVLGSWPPLSILARPSEGRAAAGGPEAVQATPRPLPSPVRPTAYLVTVGPGEAVWERFGHNLVWIHDPERGVDEGYNYGLFSFEQENFILRFIRGYMLYWMEGFDIRSQLGLYVGQDRSIWIQELALDVATVRELHAFLEWNERPENRFYRYDYYRDNCSTRVRDALDRVLGGRLGEWARDRATPASYRDHTLRQTAGVPWAAVGMHFSLGPAADRPLSVWEAMFIPMELQEHLRDFTVESGAAGPAEGSGDVSRAGGRDRAPLVRSEWTWFEGGRPATPEETPRWIPGFLLVGLALAGLVVGLGRQAGPGRGDAILVGLAVGWFAVLGVLGLLVAFAWGFTDHVYTHGSRNLFYASPVSFALAVTVWPMSRGRTWADRWGPWLALAVAALTGLGLVVEMVPGAGQVNGEFVALMAPVNLALAWWIWRRRSPSGSGGGRSPDDVLHG